MWTVKQSKSEITSLSSMHRKKMSFFPSLDTCILLHPGLNPSRPGMSLTVFFGKVGRMRGVKERGGEERQGDVPDQGGNWERFAASLTCFAV